MKACHVKKYAAALLAGLALVASGCHRPPTTSWQGYLEGEFIYVAAPWRANYKNSPCKKARGLRPVRLFTLEQSAELASLREMAERLRQAQAKLADLKKGQRPSELAALEARLAQTRTAAELSARELERATKLHQTTVLSDDNYDRARLNHEANQAIIAQTGAQLITAQLGSRVDAIAAAEAEVAATQALLDRAGWSVAQKAQTAPRAALVYDTLYREGEFVAAAAPVVALLPSENIKVRFFVPETEFATLQAGDRLQITINGRPTLAAHISYLSPQPEYTPPVLYNRENRSKLVFLVEALFDRSSTRDLHPGQPVDVTVVSTHP